MRRCAVALIITAAACSRQNASATDTLAARADSTPPSAVAAASPDTARTAADTTKAGQPLAPSGSVTQPAKAQSTKVPVTTQSTPGDTLRGRVAVTGTDRDRHIILKPGDGSRPVELHGPESATIRRVAGTDVWVKGTRDASGGFVVSSFVVRTVDGLPATDGTLAVDGSRLVLVTPDGARHTVANPPPALREHIGARMWLSGDLSKAPAAWGIISEKR